VQFSVDLDVFTEFIRTSWVLSLPEMLRLPSIENLTNCVFTITFEIDWLTKSSSDDLTEQ